MNIRFSAAATAAVLLLLSAAAVEAQDNMAEELRACSAIEDTAKRLACYDGIGEPEAPEPAPPPAAQSEPAPAPSPQSEPAPAPVQEPAQPAEVAAAPPARSAEDFGLPKESSEYESVAATVIRCGEGNDFRFYFYLDNGQVWRYIGNRRMRYRNCNTPATLTEDNFGFALKMQGEPDLRVKRVR